MMKAVLLVGGPSSGTRFRPLSLYRPKPLFPIAGKPMIGHHLNALSLLRDDETGNSLISEVLLIGFYQETEFTEYLVQAQKEFQLPIRYLYEPIPLGTGGAIYYFRNEILRDNPSLIFVLHADICSTFPLKELAASHLNCSNSLCTLLSSKINSSDSFNYGCLVTSSTNPNLVIHYVDRPETFLSELISCGVYAFSPNVFLVMEEYLSKRKDVVNGSSTLAMPRLQTNWNQERTFTEVECSEFSDLKDPIRTSFDSHGQDLKKSHLQRFYLEQDFLSTLTDMQSLYTFTTYDFWCQCKHAYSPLLANRYYLENYALLSRQQQHPVRSKTVAGEKCNIISPVWIDETAMIDETAVIGPYVTIGPNCKIGKGARIQNALLTSNVVVYSFSHIKNSIISDQCIVGEWATLLGTKDALMENEKLESGGGGGGAAAKSRKFSQGNIATTNGRTSESSVACHTGGTSILSEAVTLAPECMLLDCIVLPHKQLRSSYRYDILL